MAIREDKRVEKNLVVDINKLKTRENVRRFILNTWLEEDIGEKYRYFVETLANGKRVYLERPARLNKGCDFVIYVEDSIVWKNGKDKPPSHKHLLDDLSEKKKRLDSQTWRHLINAIEAVHAMTPYEIPLEIKEKIDDAAPMSGEEIQLLCKWLFIEQDITYWSYNGRDMLLGAIRGV